MGKTYSKDLREKVVNFIEGGGGKSQAARLFGIGRDTVHRWLRLHASGSLSPKKRTSFHQKMDIEQLKAYVAAHPDHTLKEIGKALNLAYQTVSSWLIRLQITRKKRQRATWSAMKKRALPSRHISKR